MNNQTYIRIINDPTISEEQKVKEREYKAYIDNHIANVQKAWKQFKENKKVKEYLQSFTDVGALKVIYENLDIQMTVHDASKFSEEEWEPYRMHWHSLNEEEKIQSTAAYEKAWEHHYMNNPHHWDYWAATGKNSMPLTYCIEMWCDWIAMSMAKGGNAYDWFKGELSKGEIELGEKQQKWTENVLKIFYDK